MKGTRVARSEILPDEVPVLWPGPLAEEYSSGQRRRHEDNRMIGHAGPRSKFQRQGEGDQ